MFADKFERAHGARGNREWLEHWKERKRTAVACAARSITELLTKLTALLTRTQLSSLCELCVPSELANPSGDATTGSSEQVFSRRLKRQHLFAVQQSLARRTRHEIRRSSIMCSRRARPRVCDSKDRSREGSEKAEADEASQLRARQSRMDACSRISPGGRDSRARKKRRQALCWKTARGEFVFPTKMCRGLGTADKKGGGKSQSEKEAKAGSWVAFESPRSGKKGWWRQCRQRKA